MSTQQFTDQPARNAIGFDVTCQVSALLGMLSREQKQDSSHFEDLLKATLPRLNQLNDAAMALFSDEAAVSNDTLMKCVYGAAQEPSHG